MRVHIEGVDDAISVLKDLGPREARNLLRATVHGIAGQVRDEAKSITPVDEGDVKSAIKTKRSRGKPGYIESTVGVQRQAFYWRFLEYGQGPSGVEYAMFMRSVEKMRTKLERIFIEQFGKKWEAAMNRAAKKR